MACGGGLFQSSCSPCGYVDPCAAPVYVAPVYSGCNTGCGGWGHAALSDAGSWAPESAYEAEAPPAYRGYGYGVRPGIGYGYGVRPARYGARYGWRATAYATAACVSAATIRIDLKRSAAVRNILVLRLRRARGSKRLH
jgi:hypothetical protein